MAAKKGLEVKVTLESPSKEKIREYRTQISDIQKKIKEVRLEEQIQEDIETWKKITKMKEDIQNKIKSIKGCSSWTITKFLKCPDYFEYQHPKNTKQKGSDDGAEWIAKYLKDGGSKAELIAKAREGRTKMAKKLFHRSVRKTAKKKTTTTDPAKKSTTDIRKGGIV